MSKAPPYIDRFDYDRPGEPGVRYVEGPDAAIYGADRYIHSGQLTALRADLARVTAERDEAREALIDLRSKAIYGYARLEEFYMVMDAKASNFEQVSDTLEELSEAIRRALAVIEKEKP